MTYPDEEGWYLDYPDGDEAYRRFAEQGVLSHEEIVAAMNNTNVFLEVEAISTPALTMKSKCQPVPRLHTGREKRKIYNLIWEKWNAYKQEVEKSKWRLYESEIQKR